jgi:hypothetical protein
MKSTTFTQPLVNSWLLVFSLSSSNIGLGMSFFLILHVVQSNILFLSCQQDKLEYLLMTKLPKWHAKAPSQGMLFPSYSKDVQENSHTWSHSRKCNNRLPSISAGMSVMNNYIVSGVVFWVVMPRSLVGGYQHFGQIYHLHIRGRWDNKRF